VFWTCGGLRGETPGPATFVSHFIRPCPTPHFCADARVRISLLPSPLLLFLLSEQDESGPYDGRCRLSICALPSRGGAQTSVCYLERVASPFLPSLSALYDPASQRPSAVVLRDLNSGSASPCFLFFFRRETRAAFPFSPRRLLFWSSSLLARHLPPSSPSVNRTRSLGCPPFLERAKPLSTGPGRFPPFP